LLLSAEVASDSWNRCCWGSGWKACSLSSRHRLPNGRVNGWSAIERQQPRS